MPADSYEAALFDACAETNPGVDLRQWYLVYMDMCHGSVDITALKSALLHTRDPNTLVWHDGLYSWTPAHQVPELCDVLPAALESRTELEDTTVRASQPLEQLSESQVALAIPQTATGLEDLFNGEMSTDPGTMLDLGKADFWGNSWSRAGGVRRYRNSLADSFRLPRRKDSDGNRHMVLVIVVAMLGAALGAAAAAVAGTRLFVGVPVASPVAATTLAPAVIPEPAVPPSALPVQAAPVAGPMNAAVTTLEPKSHASAAPEPGVEAVPESAPVSVSTLKSAHRWSTPRRPRERRIEVSAVDRKAQMHAILAAVRQQVPTLKPCVESARRYLPSGSYQLVGDWVITPQGSVAQARLTGPSAAFGTELQRCFTRVVAGWKFARRPAAVPVLGVPLGRFSIANSGI